MVDHYQTTIWKNSLDQVFFFKVSKRRAKCMDDERPHEQGGNIGKYSLRGARGVGLFLFLDLFFGRLGGLEKRSPLSTLFVVFFFGGVLGI